MAGNRQSEPGAAAITAFETLSKRLENLLFHAGLNADPRVHHLEEVLIPY